MLKVLDSERMQACDRAAIDDYHIPGVVLMENAGSQVVESILDHFDGQAPGSVAVLCGKGNNGGDGLVVARHLHNLGCEVVVFLIGCGADLDGDAALNYRMAVATGVPISEVVESAQWDPLGAGLSRFDCLVDALLGTGLRGAVRGLLVDVIEAINAAAVPVVAVDIPSGLCADNGVIDGVAVVAELTVTFAAPKCCHVLAPACDACGDLTVAEISIPGQVVEAAEPALWLLEPDDCRGLLPQRPQGSHKGDFGSVLVIAGAPGTAGAAVLATRGALRSGAGLVHVACPESVVSLVGGQLTEAMVHSLAANANGGVGAAALGPLQALIERVRVVALGPGLGTNEETVEIVRVLAAHAPVPMLIDADGLNALAGVLESLSAAPAPRVLTPHAGEAARLLGCTVAAVQKDRPAAARRLCELSGAVVVLKGYRTLTCDIGAIPIVNPSGNAGMATGGTGDVLAGIVAGFLAQGLAPQRSAWAAAYVHGLAGDLAAQSAGEIALLAGDLIDSLPTAIEAAGVGDRVWR